MGAPAQPAKGIVTSTCDRMPPAFLNTIQRTKLCCCEFASAGAVGSERNLTLRTYQCKFTLIAAVLNESLGGRAAHTRLTT
ncbi:hypothetical protein EVAR_62943_1 [Eumeta japonica]|uniref:Uncharacterized protein n=1 Tax=Eumeta variegata TaxID=151549 RepID=A0A4C1ZEW7_EUMVA|nr:hypothetical protein EVAR_62943_1 [Eumeta japonica]